MAAKVNKIREAISKEETKKKVDEALSRLAEALDQGRSETLTAYLKALGRFHRYSLGNTLIISMWCPEATHVAGFQTWKQFGRRVKRGEKGIPIMAPIVRRRRDREKQLEDDDVVAFRSAYVFDISQTEGTDLPAFSRVNGNPEGRLDLLRREVDRRGIVLSYSDDLSGAEGISRGGQILLQRQLSPAEEFTTLVHELAHERLHHSDGATKDRTTRETEAEAVAFVVCEAVGLETNTASRDYIQLYHGDRVTLMASLARIRETAREIIDAVEIQAPRAMAA